MPISMSKQRIKDVFNDCVENVRNGKNPNVSGNMRKAGYSPSSAKSMKVTKTKTWEDLLSQIDDDAILKKLNKIALDESDKRSCLTAIDMTLKLKNKYPKHQVDIDVKEKITEKITVDKE